MKNTLLKALQKVVLRPRCPICSRFAADNLCLDCQHQVLSCKLPTTTYVGETPLLAWGQYRGALKRSIACLKYDQQSRIAQFLGQKLGFEWLNQQPQNHQLLVIPIPLHRRRQQQRGYNQSALIAQAFCHVTGLPLALNGLVRVKDTVAQFDLPPHQRFTNVEQAFKLGPHFTERANQRSVVLVDDIYTTGATVGAAIEALRQSGIKVLGIAVVAKA